MRELDLEHPLQPVPHLGLLEGVVALHRAHAEFGDTAPHQHLPHLPLHLPQHRLGRRAACPSFNAHFSWPHMPGNASCKGMDVLPGVLVGFLARVGLQL